MTEYIEQTRKRVEAANLPKGKNPTKASNGDSVGVTSNPLSND